MLNTWYTSYNNSLYSNFYAHMFVFDISSTIAGPYYIGFTYDSKDDTAYWRGLANPNKTWSGWLESQDSGWELINGKIVLAALFDPEVMI